MPARDPHAVLAEILALTELESSLIEVADADAMLLLCEERGALLLELPPELPASCAHLVQRFAAVRDANEAAATAAAAAIRAELGASLGRRTAVSAYGSGTDRRQYEGEA